MGTSPARTSRRRTILFCGCSHEFLAATQPTRFGRYRSPSSSEIHAGRNTRSRRPRPPRSALSGVGPVSASLLWPRRRDIDADKPRPLDRTRSEARLARLVEELLHHIEESLVAFLTKMAWVEDPRASYRKLKPFAQPSARPARTSVSGDDVACGPRRRAA